jgi:hypothetical protein
MIIVETIERLKRDYDYALNTLYAIQNGLNGSDESYWRGVVSGLEDALNALGIEHEGYNPLHD